MEDESEKHSGHRKWPIQHPRDWKRLISTFREPKKIHNTLVICLVISTTKMACKHYLQGTAFSRLFHRLCPGLLASTLPHFNPLFRADVSETSVTVITPSLCLEPCKGVLLPQKYNLSVWTLRIESHVLVPLLFVVLHLIQAQFPYLCNGNKNNLHNMGVLVQIK